MAEDHQTLDTNATKVNMLTVHLALIGSYFIFGGGSLVSKIGIYGSSPLVYEFLREVLTILVLWPITLYLRSAGMPQSKHAIAVLSTGFFFFCNQACFFAGLKLADPVSAATWQASIPGFTAFVSAALGLEAFTCRKAAGIFVASVGAASLALIGSRKNGNVVAAAEAGNMSNAYIYGHLIFFLGVMSVPGYVITMKPLVTTYGALTVTTWSFTVSCTLMASTAVIVSVIPETLDFICYDENHEAAALCRESPWRMPSNMILPVIYEVLACSVLGWSALAWACRHTTATIVNLYSVVQPLAAALLAQLALSMGIRGRGIHPAGLNHITGVALIMIGLVLTLCDQNKSSSHLEVGKLRRVSKSSYGTARSGV